jgi:hypothetical protein
VHEVEPGRTVRRTREGTYVLVAEKRKSGRELADEELVLTSGGLRPRSAVRCYTTRHGVLLCLGMDGSKS